MTTSNKALAAPELRRLAASLANDTTKAAARRHLKAAGLKQALADDLLAAIDAIGKARAAKRASRQYARQGTGCYGQASRPLHQTCVQWRPRRPAGTPASRLDALRQRAVLAAFYPSYRAPEAGHGEESVALTADPAAVGVRQRISQEWGAYSRRCTYPKQQTDTTLTVPADWRLRVQRRGLAVIDGMLTLDAAPMPAPDGTELYAATWLMQGRGYALTAARGYIARRGALSYHADTAPAALAGLGRKARATDLAAQWDTAVAAHGLEGLAAHAPASAVVRIADAKAIGACDYGIKSWCHATGLPYEAGAAPLAAVLAAYRQEPRTEARAAILHALRRYRAVERLAA